MVKGLEEVERVEAVETVVVEVEAEDVGVEVARLPRIIRLWWSANIRGTRPCVSTRTEGTCALLIRGRLVARDQSMEEPVVKMLDLLSTNVLL